MSAPKIFFELYNPTGMINQLMSLEVGIGLAVETKCPTVIYNTNNKHDWGNLPIYSPSNYFNDQRKEFTKRDQCPHILDLIDINTDAIIIHEKIENFPQEEEIILDIMTNWYFSNTTEITDDELAFADGRKKLIVDKPLHLKRVLCWYSRFFYNRSPELNKVLSSIKFKNVYLNLAKKISYSLGNFQGMHLRLSDHVVMFETKQEVFEAWLDKYEKNNIPIVVSTCEPNHPMVQKNKDRFILLDEYIVSNFADEFHDLPFQDEVVFGLICNLVLHDSINFVGTPGSTYTGYIQRIRNNKGIETWDFFDNPIETDIEPYSWINYPLDATSKNWYREWKESKI
jgi:hypothetical protein